MSLRRAAVRYVKSVYATVAPLPDPPEVASTVQNRRINWFNLGSAIRIGTQNYVHSWKSLLNRNAKSKPKPTTTTSTTRNMGQDGSDEETATSPDGNEPLLTKDDREELMAGGARVLSNLRDGLIEFLRGYREGKAEEEAKGPIKF